MNWDCSNAVENQLCWQSKRALKDHRNKQDRILINNLHLVKANTMIKMSIQSGIIG